MMTLARHECILSDLFCLVRFYSITTFKWHMITWQFLQKFQMQIIFGFVSLASAGQKETFFIKKLSISQYGNTSTA